MQLGRSHLDPTDEPLCCLSMVWYMTDVDENSGGTFCVPGAHRDSRNPRGPTDGITVTAPIPGDMQVTAPAGSVFIQDSRMWHSTACHNVSGKLRVAGQNRWVPWWFNERYCADSAGEVGPGENGWVSLEEWEAMPEGLKPLMAHRCQALGWDMTQQSVRDRGACRSCEPACEPAARFLSCSPMTLAVGGIGTELCDSQTVVTLID
jgi:hypothetical protein